MDSDSSDIKMTEGSSDLDIKILTTVETKNTKKSIQKSIKPTDNISPNELGDVSPIRKRARLNDKDNEIFNKLVSLNNMKKQVLKPIVIAKTADTKKKLVNVFSNKTNDFDHTNDAGQNEKLDGTRNSKIIEVYSKSNRVEKEIKLDNTNNRVEVNNTSNATKIAKDEINKTAQMTDNINTNINDGAINLGDSTVTVLIADNDTTFPVNYSTSEPLKNLYTLLFGINDGKLFYKNMLLSKYSNLKTIKYTGDIIKLQGKCVYKGINVKINYDFEKQINLTYYEPTSMQTVIEEIESKLLIKVKQVRNNFGIITKSYIVKEDEVFDIFK